MKARIRAHKRNGEWTWTIGTSVPVESSRVFRTKREALADARILATNCGLIPDPNAEPSHGPSSGD